MERDFTIYVAKTKALISCMFTMQLISCMFTTQLICAFVFPYTKKPGFLMILLICHQVRQNPTFSTAKALKLGIYTQEALYHLECEQHRC